METTQRLDAESSEEPPARERFAIYAIKRVGLALLAIWVTMTLSFVVYLHLGEYEYAHPLSKTDVRALAGVFGPGHSTVHVYLRYVVSTLEGGLGYTIDGPLHRGQTFGDLWGTLAWVSIAVVVAVTAGLFLGSRSLSRSKPLRRGVVAATALASLQFVPLLISLVWLGGKLHLMTVLWWPSHLATTFVLVAAIGMTGEYALLTRAAIDAQVGEQEVPLDRPELRAFRRDAIQAAFPSVLRGISRSLGYLAAAVVAAEFLRDHGLGIAAIAYARQASPWLAGVFFSFTAVAIVVWLILDLLTCELDRRVAGEPPRPTAGRMV